MRAMLRSGLSLYLRVYEKALIFLQRTYRTAKCAGVAMRRTRRTRFETQLMQRAKHWGRRLRGKFILIVLRLIWCK